MKTFVKAIIMSLLCMPCAAMAGDNIDELREKADMMHAQGKNDSAVIVAEKALGVAVSSGNAVAQLGLHSSIGVYMRTMGNMAGAMEHYNQAMKLCTDADFRKKADEDARQEAAVLYLNIATLHVDTKHKKEALLYAHKAYHWAVLCKDSAFKAQLSGNLGTVFVLCGDADAGRRVLGFSYDCAMGQEMWDAALTAAANMLLLGDKAGRAGDVAVWEKRCRMLVPKAQGVMSKLMYYQVECGMAMNKGDNDKALGMFSKIMSLDGIAGMPFVVYDCYNNIHEIYAGKGDYSKAYEYLQKASAIRDSLYEKEKTESLRELTVKYEAKEKELALSQSETKLARMQLYVAGAAILIVVLAVSVYIYMLRSRNKAREREAEFARLRADTGRRMTEKYISGLESERKRLARELHDGLCNDIYNIELRLAASDGSSSAAGLLAGCREQARRISHELMPPEFRYATIDEVLSDYVERVASAASGRVCYESLPHGASWNILPDDISFGIYRIVQEALSNAVRHSGATDIKVVMKMEGGRVEVCIADNGSVRGRKPEGIGGRTMRQRAEAIGADMSIDNGGGGTTVRIVINLDRQ